MSAARVAFSGEVRCETAPGAVNLCLQGRERHTQLPLAVMFSGASLAVPLPATLTEAEVLPGEPGTWRLTAAGLECSISARAMQVHADAAAPFYAALDLPAASLARRAQWALLFTLLRLPGAAWLLRRLRVQ